jgi:hypothetical protein
MIPLQTAMNVQDYIKSQTCSTDGLAPLSKQIAAKLFSLVPASEIIDISAHVKIIGGSTLPFLQRKAGEALIEAITDSKRKPQLTHALRVAPQQECLYQWYLAHRCSITLAAPIGASPHERAIAIDLHDWHSWIDHLRKYNWIWRGDVDKPHFNYHGKSNPDFNVSGIKAFQLLWNDHNLADPLTVDGVIGPTTIAKLLASPVSGW